MDARLKSDLILLALDQPATKALVPFTPADAIKLLGKFPQWKAFLDRKKAALAAKAAKREPRRAEMTATGGRPSRQQVRHGGRVVQGLYERETATGGHVFETRLQVSGAGSGRR